MAITRNGSWSSSLGSTHAHTNPAGSDRIMVVAIGAEIGTTTNVTSVDYGGQALTQAVEAEAGTGFSYRLEIWYLLEAGIAAASNTTITPTFSSAPADTMIAAMTYDGVDQGGGSSTIPETNSDTTAASTPNPLTGGDVTEAPDNAVVSAGGVGNATSATWGSDLTEQVDLADASSTLTVADRLSTTSNVINCEATWASQNRACMVALELGAASLDVTVTPSPTAAVFSAEVPTLVIGAVTLTPDPTGAALSADVPSIANVITVLPDSVSVSSSLTVPVTILGTVTVSPDAVSGALSADVPVLVIGGLTVTPDSVVATLDAEVPSIANLNIVTPDAVAASSSLPDPVTIIGEVTLTPDSTGAVLDTADPTLVLGEITLTPDPIAASLSTEVPSISSVISVTPDAVAFSSSVPIPTIEIGSTVTAPSSVAVGFSVATPTLVIGTVTLTPSPLVIGSSLPLPTINPFVNIVFSVVYINQSEAGVGNVTQLDTKAGQIDQAVDKVGNITQLVTDKGLINQSDIDVGNI